MEHAPGTTEPPRDARLRLAALVFLGALAIVVLSFGAWWGIPLLLVELFHRPIRRFWTRAEDAVDSVRGWLAPAKKLPGALIGLPLLFVGLGAGLYAPSSVNWLGDGVATAVGGIAKAAPYVIFFTLTPAIASTLAVGRAGKFALWVTSAYVILTILAGLLAMLILVPVFGVRWSGPGAKGAEGVQANLLELLFSSGPFIAIFAAAGLALMIHGFGLKGLLTATRFVGGKLVDLLGDLLKILLPLILFALGVFIPTRVGEGLDAAREAGQTQGSGWAGQLSPELAYFVAVAALVLVLGVWIVGFAVAVMRYVGFSLKTFFVDYFFDVFAYAWATASSNATMPLNIERAGNGLKVRQNIREFIIPLGATVHLDGTMIGGMVTAVIAAQLVGYTPTVLDLLYVLIPLMIVAVGAPGVPGGLAIVGAPVIANLLPLPPGSQAAFTAIFVGFNLGLSDQFRTGVNATGNGILCRLFEHWYPKRFARPEAKGLRGMPAELRPKTRRPAARRRSRPQQA